MDNIEYLLRYVLCFLAIAVLLNCVWSLIRLRPTKKIYAVLVDMADNSEYPITCYETSIGRSKSCDVVFSNGTVSRSHAVVALRKDGFYVFDTESKSGVYVNKEKIDKSRRLADGDIIAFGTAIMTFYIGSDASNDYKTKKGEEIAVPRIVNIVDGGEFILDEDYITIGRQAGSNIEISAPYISRRQAEIYKSGNAWYIQDLSRVTKTTVNGNNIKSPTRLKDGDVIKMGDFGFLFEAK